MKNKKITWLIIFLLVMIVFVGGGYYVFVSEKQEPVFLTDVVKKSQNIFHDNFFNFVAEKKKLPLKSEEVSLIAVGDISYSRGVERITKEKKDINYPFLKIQDYLQGADLVFGNLETPLTVGEEIPTGEMIFRSNPSTAQALREANFSVLSLANNHTPNFGAKGLEDTFKYLDEAGIKYVGAGRNEVEANQPVYLDAKGIKFAFLAYNDEDVVPDSYEAGINRAGTAFMRSEKMAISVEEAKKQADFVIVSMHSGIEYVSDPNQSQINFAHASVDAGADLVIGHHPHVVQTMEKYHGKYIFYSLGNFIFDQSWSENTEEGLAIKIYFTKEGIGRISFLPVAMENFSQPEIAKKERADKILKRLSYPLVSQNIYSWDEVGGDFIQGSASVIYEENQEGYCSVVQRKEQADLNNNLIPEIYSLADGVLVVAEDGRQIWRSSDDWWVDNFYLADANNDGIKDLNLSLWKVGNFGSSRPFWVEENDPSIKNHFFIFNFKDGAIVQVWGSSNLSAPNCEFIFADLDNDEKNELIVLEGDYTQSPECQGNYVAVWKWNGWGFFNEWRSAQGNYSNLEIEKIGGKNYIKVDSF